MVRVSDFVGAALFAPQGGRNASPGVFSQMGKLRAAVFSPDGLCVTGFLVRRPDIAGMVKRDDLFVALDALVPCDGGVRVTRGAESFDDAARARLELDWDACVLWLGMDVVTRSGRDLGVVGDASFDAKTGVVTAFFVEDGAAARSLVGSLELPSNLFVGYERGRMLVSDEATHLAPSGGLAASAGAAVGRAQAEGAKVAAKASAAAGRAVDNGSKALGRQLGKAKGMFGAFMDEYKRASE